MENFLEIKNLHVKYKTLDGEKTVLAIEQLNIQKGTTFGLVGESGSGKTVLAQTIMGLLATPPGVIESGEILLEGEDLLRKTKKEMEQLRGEKMAMIFQDPLSCLNPVFTVHQQMLNVVRAHRNIPKAEADKMINDMVRKVKLPDPERTIEKYPHELSGGQRQRIIIAMALLCGAEFLIADEPTRNLDVTIQAGILKLISELQKEFRVTVLFIANNLGLVSAVCDQAAILKDGEILEQVPAKRLLEDTREPYTRQLIDAITPDTGETHHNYNPSEIILDVKNLKKYYMVGRKGLFGEKEYVKSVDGVSFTLHRGETLAIVGESGCGKSTTVKSLIRVTEPTSGEVILKGQDFLKLKGEELKKARRNIKMIFQDPYSSLNPRMTVRDIIGEPVDIEHCYKTEEEREKLILDTMELVGLNRDFADRYPHEFSGGQRQRIGIARAIILKPEIIICDEPVSALDVSVQAKIINLLKELQQKLNISYIFISHDLGVVKHIADRVMVMYRGHVVEEGTRDEIFTHPKHDYTKLLLSSIPKIGEKMDFEAFDSSYQACYDELDKENS